MKNLLFYVFLMLLTFSILAVNSKAENLLPEYAVENLITGMKSENQGLVKSSIYLSGKYKVTEAVVPLIDILENSKDGEVRKLCAAALYEIGDMKGLQIISVHALNEKDTSVAEKCRRLYNEFLQSELIKFSEL